MIAIHAEGTRGGLAGALARGGLLVTADELVDIDRLTAWCVALGGSEPGPYPVRPYGDRRNQLAQLYADLIAGGPRLAAESTGRPGEPAWRTAVQSMAANTADTRDPLDTLTLALATLFDAWSLEPAGTPDIELALAIADPMRPGAGETTVEVAAPAAMLTLRPGSLIPGLGVQALLTAAGWAAVVLRKTARAFTPLPAAAARRLVEGARARGTAQARHKELPRLDRLSGEEHEALRKASTVVILLHGLFSTDRGTFDGFIDRLRQADPMTLGTALEGYARDHAAAIVFGAGTKETIEERFKQHIAAANERNPAGMQALILRDGLAQRLAARVAVVGWPHDTLTSIGANAGELADLIDRVFAGMEAPPRIAFVAHSRGGLVARATAAELLSSPSAARWRDVLSAIVTFGTPHDGAALAEHDARGLATYLLLAQSTGRVASIGDVLTYLDARTAEGLENLKPVNAVTESREQSFVDRLYERERGLRDGGHRRPPLIAVGGRLDEEGRGDWRKRIAGALVDRWLDQPDHDLVVELDSSTSPRTLPDVTMTVMSSHFEYFTTMAATHEWVFDIALASIWSTVDLATALANISPDHYAPEKAMFPIRYKSKTPRTDSPL